jgi:hypothetical protein
MTDSTLRNMDCNVGVVEWIWDRVPDSAGKGGSAERKNGHLHLAHSLPAGFQGSESGMEVGILCRPFAPENAAAQVETGARNQR